jgi:hypothetical protein
VAAAAGGGASSGRESVVIENKKSRMIAAPAYFHLSHFSLFGAGQAHARALPLPPKARSYR